MSTFIFRASANSKAERSARVGQARRKFRETKVDSESVTASTGSNQLDPLKKCE